MTKIGAMIRYFYSWQPTILFVAALGAIAFVLKIPAAVLDADIAFFLGVFSYTFLLVIPFCSASTAMRHLMANHQVAMVPGFRLQAGLAHLVIAAGGSVFLYLNWLVFTDTAYSPLVMLRTFSCLSLFAGFMQLVLPSRLFIVAVSIGPLIVALVIVRFQETAAFLFLDPAWTIALFLACLTGWGYGLWLLHSRDTFRPANVMVGDAQAWATYDGGILTRQSIGRSRTAAGTLLLGYPDSRIGILVRVGYYFVFTPLITTLGLFLVGIGEKWDKPATDIVFTLFLLCSLFSAVYCIFIHGELVARARLLWLRFSTNRQAQWRLVESFNVKYLLTYYLCAGIIAGLAALLTDLPAGWLVHYLLIIISYCFFNLYLAQMLRAHDLHWFYLIFSVMVSAVLLFSGIYFALDTETRNPGLLFGVEGLFLVLAVVCRSLTRKTFLQIDWKLITLKMAGRSAALGQE